MFNNHKTYQNTNLRDNQKVFTDGLCFLYEAHERNLGNKKGKFYFCDETVGLSHYFEAYNNNIDLDMAISIPYNKVTIDPQDVIKINDTFYYIRRIVYHDNKKPSYWTLYLSRANFEYKEFTR